LNETNGWVAPVTDSPKPPPNRITLTLPVITHSHKIAFYAAGGEKKDILKTIMEDPDQGLPCSLVNVAGGEKVFWFVDAAAAQNTLHPKKEYKLWAAGRHPSSFLSIPSFNSSPVQSDSAFFSAEQRDTWSDFEFGTECVFVFT
jgi:hypothetical protein